MDSQWYRSSVVLFFYLALQGCATPMSKGSHCAVEPGYLDAEQSFRWHSTEPITLKDDTGYISPLMLDELTRSISAELASKGFAETQDPTATALEMTAALHVRRELNAVSVSESPCVHQDCWERVNMGGNTRMDIRTIGFLSMDVFHQGKPIWRGWVERPLYPKDRDTAGEVIRLAVPALLESFPP